MSVDGLQTVMIVEDDPDIVMILHFYLVEAGYRVLSAGDGERALSLLDKHEVSVVLADIMMPGMSGYDLIKEIRRFSSVPVIIISARDMPADKVLGLDVGADGYITKPFDALEVMAYIRAVLRRSTAAVARNRLSAGCLSLDTSKLQLTKKGSPVSLTAAEFKIMACLIAEPGRVFTKEQLYACTCDPGVSDMSGCEASVMVHISNLRAKIEDDPPHPRYIRTVRGMGYRLDA